MSWAVLVSAAIGYLLGSIPFGLLLTRLAGLGDIRQIGSGSIGATNVLRTGSRALAALTLAFDVVKGSAAALIGGVWGEEAALAGGAAVVIGLMFPVWLGFRGGKGVATALGVLLVIAWKVTLLAALLWLATAAIFRYSSLAAPIVAVVGARNASANGRRLARDLAAELGEAGIVVVSGLARGIDAAAHLGALEKGSVAVVAGGADIVYPEENRGLHEALARDGAILAEMPLGTEPQARHFPRRNRIISGIALGVVVVEAAAKSGSLITARFALEQGREVFAVPGSPLDPRSRGANDLLRNGATLTETSADILAQLGPLPQGRPIREIASAQPRLLLAPSSSPTPPPP